MGSFGSVVELRVFFFLREIDKQTQMFIKNSETMKVNIQNNRSVNVCSFTSSTEKTEAAEPTPEPPEST